MNLKNLPVRRTFTVKILNGVHARPSAHIAQIVRDSGLQAFIFYQDIVVDASSMLEILELNIPLDAELTFFFNSQNLQIFQLIEEALREK